jgi:hypothetical protein
MGKRIPIRVWHHHIVWLILVGISAVFMIVVGMMLLWIYPPMSSNSDRQIAAELFKYRQQFSSQGYMSIGLTPVLPDPLLELCPRDRVPSCHTDINSASMVYSDTRLGVYYERWFEVKRSGSNDISWTFTRAGGTYLPIKGWVYFERSICVTNNL